LNANKDDIGWGGVTDARKHCNASTRESWDYFLCSCVRSVTCGYENLLTYKKKWWLALATHVKGKRGAHSSSSRVNSSSSSVGYQLHCRLRKWSGQVATEQVGSTCLWHFAETCT
jgi:hypothetical protein